jgi:alanine racemase
LSCKAFTIEKAVNNWIEVSTERLTANYLAIQAAVGPETTVLAVIKADAYGHGAATCAPILVRAGATWLGVTCAAEGASVRKALAAAALEAEILIMSGFLPGDAPLIHQHNLTPVVWAPEQIAALNPGTRVHIEVDTGMGRQGVTPGPALDELLAKIAAAIFTHFCSSEVANSPITALQQHRFEAVVAQLVKSGHKPTWLHAANTSAVDNPADPPDPTWLPKLAATLNARTIVRTGLALYGYTLPIENATHPHLLHSIKPVLTWRARILAVRTLAPGETIGYNATYTAEGPIRVALIPAGYADGLRRELSSTNAKPGGWVMIHNQRAPILGRISMNLTVVDVTHIPAAQPNDEAILLGDGITADDHARLAQTIPYEILCGIHPCG